LRITNEESSSSRREMNKKLRDYKQKKRKSLKMELNKCD
jgi:hypothetical protein